MERRILSSEMTFFMNFIFAPLFIVAAWWWPISALAAGNLSRTTLFWVVVAVYVTVSMIINVRTFRRVEVAGDRLLVSNYFNQIDVPLDQVYAVYVDGGRHRYAAIYFTQETEFGWKVKFHPGGLNDFVTAERCERNLREALKISAEQEHGPVFEAR